MGGCASLSTAQIPPAPEALWQPPDLRHYTTELKRPESPILDREKRYELVELIDLAERVNPETRVAWERARQAAAVVGLAASEYFPILVLHASAGGQSIPFPIPTNVVPEGVFRADNLLFNPTLALRWLLFDFGSRRATFTAATEHLLAANLGFNHKHQQIVFTVQQSFYALTSTRARIAVARAALESASTVQAAAEERLRRGLATLPEASLARQQAVQAAFDLEDVVARERDAQVTLAQSIGIALGLLVFGWIDTQLWPVRAVARVRPSLAKALRSMADLARLPSHAGDPDVIRSQADALRLHIYEGFATVQQLVAETRFEPGAAAREVMRHLLAEAQAALLVLLALVHDRADAALRGGPVMAWEAANRCEAAVAESFEALAAGLEGQPRQPWPDLAGALAALERSTAARLHDRTAAAIAPHEDGRLVLYRQLVPLVERLGAYHQALVLA